MIIKTPRWAFIRLCESHGTTLEAVRACIVEDGGGVLKVDTEHLTYPKPPMPTIAERVRNFAKSAVSHVAAGMPRCTQEEIDARYAICQTCEHLRDGACTQCGCPVVRERAFVSKLSWSDQACPVGKWGKINSPDA